jgi:hypothetical protein
MRTRAVAPLAVLAAAALAPAAASAASAEVDRACYLQSAKARVTITGSGFAPGRPFRVEIAGEPVEGASGTVDEAGVARTTFMPPAVAREDTEGAFTVSLVQDDISADASFSVTRFLADFNPDVGKPATLKVRFSAYGFGLVQANPLAPVARTVYVHYVDPAGKLRRTTRLGRTAGPCGHILKTAQQRLFPFKPRAGEWTLQFDTSATYRRGTTKSNFLYYARGIRIRPPTR